MAGNCNNVKMAEVANVIMGQSPKGHTYNRDGIGTPLLNGPTEFGPHHPTPALWTTAPTRFCQPGDLLFCVRGSTTGRMNWADAEFSIGRGLCAFRGKAGPSDTQFIYYTLLSELPRLLSLSAGSVFPNLSKQDLDQFEMNWPDTETRSRVAHTLGALDDQIELNRRMNETLEAMARAIFRSWFVDFDPVRAKAEGRKPEGVDAETAALFPSSFVDSPVGRIPKGWRVANLPQVIEVNPARRLSMGKPAPYLQMSNMPTSSARALRWEMREFRSGTKFANGDVLLARITPCLENGKTAYVDFLRDGQCGWGSTEFIVLCSRPHLPPEYTYFLCRTEELRSHAIRNMSGTSGRQRVPASCFDSYQLVVPNESVATRFGQTVRMMLEAMKSNDEQSATLTTIRDGLLPKLLSGELSVDG